MFLVEEPATWLVLRKLVGAPDQMDFGEEHVASFLVLFSFCRQNHILPKLCPHFSRFCFLSPRSTFFSFSSSQTVVYIMQQKSPHCWNGISTCHLSWASYCDELLLLGTPKKTVAQMSYHMAAGLLLLDEASSSSQDPFRVSVGLLLSGDPYGFTADGFSWRIEKRLTISTAFLQGEPWVKL